MLFLAMGFLPVVGATTAEDEAGEEPVTLPPQPIPEIPPSDWDAEGGEAGASGSDDVSVLCHTRVNVDNGHSPAGQWSAHGSPRFTWGKTCGNAVHYYRVDPSWRGHFDTSGTSWHTTAPEGEHSIRVNTLYKYNHCHWHRHWWYNHCHNHVHYEWGGWGYSQVVKIDLSAPAVDISGISQPKVVDGQTTYVTSASDFTLSASDRYSGLAAVEHRFDAASYQDYAGAFRATDLEDGAHTLDYRALDNVGHGTSKSFDFILDNTAPEITLVHPTYNSVNVNRLSVEPCTEDPRVTFGDETLAEVERPETPGAPDVPPTPALPPAPALPPMPPMPPMPPLPGVDVGETPGAPDDVPGAAPDAVTGGPDACGGDVVETAPVILPAQQVPVPEDLDTPPEVPAGTEETVAMEGQDVGFTQPVVATGTVDFVVDVQDATVGLQNVQFLVNDAIYDDQTGDNGIFTYSWDTTKERAGEHTFTFRAFDRLGNVDEFSITVIVVTQTEEGSAETVAHSLAEGEAEADRRQAEAEAAIVNAESAVADAEGEAQSAIADAEGEAENTAAEGEAEAQAHAAAATAEACAAAGVWAQFVPQCTSED